MAEAQSSYPYPPMANPVAVISPQYCAPYPVDLTIVRNHRCQWKHHVQDQRQDF
ncbi:hypothetical protein CsSME_00017652 [Camellia sinensis var. sinensis]